MPRVRGHDEHKGEPFCMPHEDLPYRPCVGTMVLNHEGRVFIGRRASGPAGRRRGIITLEKQPGIRRGDYDR